jgi:hypothetical protein
MKSVVSIRARRALIGALVGLPWLLRGSLVSAQPLNLLKPHQAIRHLCAGVFVSPGCQNDKS